MAADVNFNYSASDRTAMAAAAVVRRAKDAQKQISKDSEKKAADVAKFLEKTVGAVSPRLAKALQGPLVALAPTIGPALVAGAVSAAPLMGAAIAGGIIGGAGIGGVVGGTIIAFRDPRVQSAAAAFTTRLTARLEHAAEPFVATTLSGISRIDSALGKINFERIFANSSKFAAPLTEGVARAVEAIGGALDRLIAKAGPAVNAIAAGIASVGQHLADGLESLSDNSKDGAAALDLLFMIINSGIDTTFQLINVLTELYGIGQKIGADTGLRLALLAMGAGVKDLGTFTPHTAGALDDLGGSATAAAEPIKTLADRLHDASDASRSLYDSTVSVKQALADAEQSIKENGKTLDLNKEKGRDNARALSTLGAQLTSNYEKYAALNGAGPKTIAVAESNRAAFLKVATQLTGSATKAQELANKLLGIPNKKDIHLTDNTHDAAARMAALQQKINAVHGKSITIEIKARYPNLSAAQLTNKGLMADIPGRWGMTDRAASGTARAGGPARFDVQGDVQVGVTIDGGPFKYMVAGVTNRQAWRQKVGRR